MSPTSQPNWPRASDEEFREFLKTTLPPEEFRILDEFCQRKPCSYFGFYDTGAIYFAPCLSLPGERPAKQYLPDEFAPRLTAEQRKAFSAAFLVLDAPAPARILEAIRCFCHY